MLSFFFARVKLPVSVSIATCCVQIEGIRYRRGCVDRGKMRSENGNFGRANQRPDDFVDSTERTRFKLELYIETFKTLYNLITLVLTIKIILRLNFFFFLLQDKLSNKATAAG